MKRIAAAAAAAGFALVLSAGSALAAPEGLTPEELERQAACLALATDPDAVATYDRGTNPNPQDDSCTVVSTATTVEEAITQVNNPRAAKAVNRVVTTETTVTTTQAYRWQVSNNPNILTGWVPASDPVTDEEAAIISQCIENPGGVHCG
jgi:hypothetical protein